MTAQERIEKAIKRIDLSLDILVNRPGMLTGTRSMHTAELLLVHHLWTRADLCGCDLDVRKWYLEQYPAIPGNVRDIARYILGWDEHAHLNDEDIHAHLDDWKREAGGLVRWSIEQMTIPWSSAEL